MKDSEPKVAKLLNLTTGTLLGVYSSEGLAIFARQALAPFAPAGADLFVLRRGEEIANGTSTN